MKRTIILGLSAVLLLAGCTEESTETSASAQTESAEATAPEQEVKTAGSADAGLPDYYEGTVANPQVTDDRSVTKPGDVFRDRRGQIELLKTATDSKTVNLSGIELTVHTAKVFTFQPDYSLTDYYHHFTEAEEFAVANLFVEIRNTTDSTVQFAPVATIETDTGEERTWEDDIYLEELNGELAAGETVKGTIGFVLDQAEAGALTVTTSDVFDVNDELIAEAQTFTIEF